MMTTKPVDVAWLEQRVSFLEQNLLKTNVNIVEQSENIANLTKLLGKIVITSMEDKNGE